MANTVEIEQAAQAFVKKGASPGQPYIADKTFRFFLEDFSGSVGVAEWEPIVSGGELLDNCEIVRDLYEWIGGVAFCAGIETNEDEIFAMMESLQEATELRDRPKWGSNG